MTDSHAENYLDPCGGDADGDGGEPDARECGGDGRSRILTILATKSLYVLIALPTCC